MAGLRAAFELRKKGIPYRIFEGSDRVGGRVWTLDALTPAGQSGELGAEWFSQEQTVFWELAKELKLEMVEVKGQRDRAFLDRDSGLAQIPGKDLTKLREVARASEGLRSDRGFLAKHLDAWKNAHAAKPNLAALEWALGFSDDAAWAELIQAWSFTHYGVPASEIRSQIFARPFLFHDQVLDVWGGNRFRYRAGSSSLASALTDRVMGAIPGDRLRLGHRLTRVEKMPRGYEVHFETPEGRRRYRALHVICALPWATLKKVEGFEDFSTAELINNPVVSHQAKGILTFADRFWRKKWDQGRLLGPEPLWESTFRIQEWLENPVGLVSRVWSGDKAQQAGPHLIQETLKHLQTLEKVTSLPLLDSALKNWSNTQWTLGRGSYPSLSQKEREFEKHEDTWIWAGEHAAGELAGTWFGALETGLLATRSFAAGKPLMDLPQGSQGTLRRKAAQGLDARVVMPFVHGVDKL